LVGNVIVGSTKAKAKAKKRSQRVEHKKARAKQIKASKDHKKKL